jgi:hypothetical protein
MATGIFILRYLGRLRFQEDEDKLEILLKEARDIKPSNDTGHEKPELFLIENIWVLRKDVSGV